MPLTQSRAQVALDDETALLADGWRMQAAAVAGAGGQTISNPSYDAARWYPVRVPCTVLAGLVANGEYPNLYYGDNLRRVSVERFRGGWWYRRALDVPALDADRRVWLEFKGINYRAEIWVNGRRIAGPTDTAGTYRDFEFDVTPVVQPGAANALAVCVYPPDPKRDLAITFVDWAPAPPDRNMGLWQDVVLKVTGPVRLRRPFVATALPLPGLSPARLTVEADLENATDQAQSGILSGSIEGRRFSQPVSLGPHERRTLAFAPEAYPQLILAHPRLWWPYGWGRPERYRLGLALDLWDQSALDGARPRGLRRSDTAATPFGIRRVDLALQDGHALFSVNGVKLLVLGGGYAPDLLQRRSFPDRPDWQEDQIRYVRDMGLNTVRLEGKLEDDAFYDLCDRYGVLVMAGWCCCSPWERWKNWGPEQHTVANASLRYQIERARNHPSMLVWLNGSDHHPPPEVERDYLAIERELHWPCPILSSASASPSAVTGPSGVKMDGPYKWEPPIFWTTDRTTGGAWGFNTEVGPGAVPPPLESLRAMLPPGHLWPIDDMWDFHAGGGTFRKIGDFTEAMDRRFGPAVSASDFSWKAQAQAYETIRAMFEAFRRNQFGATGEIQWMLNNAWPSTIWHLYDYYLRPGAVYFATKLACEPLHLVYGYDDRTVALANSGVAPARGLEAAADLYDLGGRRFFHRSEACAIGADSAARLFAIPDGPSPTPTYFLRLMLRDERGKVIGVNSYWLSTKPEIMGPNGGKDSWSQTPVRQFTDYTALQTLPVVTLRVDEVSFRREGGETAGRLRVANPPGAVALLVRLRLLRGAGGAEVLPVRWSDNYFTLLPGESREVSVRCLTVDLGAAPPQIAASCFNNRNEAGG